MSVNNQKDAYRSLSLILEEVCLCILQSHFLNRHEFRREKSVRKRFLFYTKTGNRRSMPLELIGEQLADFCRYVFFAGADRETEHLKERRSVENVSEEKAALRSSFESHFSNHAHLSLLVRLQSQ